MLTNISIQTKDISKQNNFQSPRSLKNPGSDITSEIPLISAEGEIEEIFACLKMLAKYFKIPLRQDVVLRTLNSLKKESTKISINEFAQLLSNLGLQIHRTKVLPKDVTM